MFTEQLPATILQRRRALNLTQVEAARLVGVSARTWQAWEAGTAFPWPKHRRALDRFLTEPPVAA